MLLKPSSLTRECLRTTVAVVHHLSGAFSFGLTYVFSLYSAVLVGGRLPDGGELASGVVITFSICTDQFVYPLV